MHETLNDGSAVAACRAHLQSKGIPGSGTWRSTVVTQYVVRTWITVPADQSRPQGTPDYVYVATPDEEVEGGFRIQQVHPQDA